jgi:hypothetical protein
MFVYEDQRMSALQARFEDLRGMVDAATEPVRRFQPNHRSEIYKAVLKSLTIADSVLVDLSVRLAQDRYPAGDVLVYPMLHLAGDANERGSWHRDGAETKRRVFWIPLTPYKYPGLSIVDWSSGVLSTLVAFAGSRFLSLDRFAAKLTIAPNTYYAWSPRMVHRGNFNTSDDLSSAMVIFLDQTVKPTARKLTKLEPDIVRQWLGIIDAAIVLDHQGNIARVDQERLRPLDEPFQANFVSYFKLRTRIDLYQL